MVDGALSQACYLRCVDACYSNPGGYGNLASVDYCVFHAPYNKLVRKAHARLALRDKVDRPKNWCVAGDVEYEQSLVDKGLDASLRKASADDYDNRVAPSTEAPRHIGNCYTASVFFGLVSLVSTKDLEGKRVLLFSYGSGAVASMYVLKGRAGKISLGKMRSTVDLAARLSKRVERSAAEFAEACDAREAAYGAAPYEPLATGASWVPLASGAFFLRRIDGRHRREYGRAG